MAHQITIPLADTEDWTDVLEPLLCKNAVAAERLAQLLFTIKSAIDSGAEGAEQASKMLLDGIETIYLYTNAHKAAVKLYVLSLEGNLKPQDEPLNLINAALERGKSHQH
ncbi:MAG TPA: hypothetical protein VF721_11340 [Pyrinomonadaceae bacterium]